MIYRMKCNAALSAYFALCSVIIVLCVLHSSFLDARPYRVLESESPYTIPQFSIEAGLLLGYENGYIPDYLAKPQLAFGLFSWWQIAGSLSYVYYPDQEIRRVTEYDVKTRFKLPAIAFMNTNLYLYARWHATVGDPILIPYTGDLDNVIGVLSPRADGSRDISGGIAGRSSIWFLHFLYAADYARVDNSRYFPDTEDYKNRIFGVITPAIYSDLVSSYDRIMLGVQNRFTYWFERGYMYEVMPQVTWEYQKLCYASAGVSIPASAGNEYKYLVEVTYLLDLGGVRANVSCGPSLFSPDGDGKGDYLSIRPEAKSRNRVVAWEVGIYNRKDRKRARPFKVWWGKGEPPREIKWDGKSKSGYKVVSFEKYDVVLSARDDAGNRDVDDDDFEVDILLERVPIEYTVSFSNILFDYNRDNLKKSAYPILDKLSGYLNDRYKKYRIEVHGHTDNKGAPDYNLKLSTKRAKVVLNYLKQSGVSEKRMIYRGFGETRPAATNSTGIGRQRNRRVEIILPKR